MSKVETDRSAVFSGKPWSISDWVRLTVGYLFYLAVCIRYNPLKVLALRFNDSFTDIQEVEAMSYLDCRCLILETIIVSCSDVNFIASPPSMVAAGSVVAAVQGLYLKTQDASLSSQNLTNFLSQIIRSDPVCKHMLHQNPFIQAVECFHEIFGLLLKPIACFQDCLRACQEQIESLLELNLRQAQQHSGTTEPKRVDGEVDLSCTPTDVRDVNIWNDWRPCGTLTLSWRKSCERGAGWEGRCCHWDASQTAAVLCDCQANGRLPCNKNPGHISCQCPLPSWEKK